ncbi:hypothetical protein [Rathayibacter sp. AY1C1]|uniref:hypothetical protein n=1 Tax=Rathayibacter sp. AY1C1 TaxID=2080534 RepID=UPI0011B0AC7B|nr:hypothetical protein [Rathayibacter sp. AY1C1]
MDGSSKFDAAAVAMKQVGDANTRASNSLDKIADAFTGHLVDLKAQGASNGSKLDRLLKAK